MQIQQINLLKAMSVEEASVASLPSWLSWLLTGLILLTGVGIYKKNAEIALLHQDISGLEKKKTFLIEEMGEAEAAMKDVVQILAANLSNRIRWSELMREVSMIIPEGVWITRWESVTPPKNPQSAQNKDKPAQAVNATQIIISGEALSQEQLTLFLLTLERSPLLIASRLAHARQINGEVRFEIGLTLKTGESL